ncbi:hypothetical protein CH063_12075 [Colletotrichum higginsianum]|uniref:Uncharacterized protein n=1 Tax=Colletotrichum higginsianum (strain IMI 349063) TaxID=759273 RepID=H1VNZ8_COLHI|nr:hypothetical protein CH063_12075 [Colletotrichum higginsianum]
MRPLMKEARAEEASLTSAASLEMVSFWKSSSKTLTDWAFSEDIMTGGIVSIGRDGLLRWSGERSRKSERLKRLDAKSMLYRNRKDDGEIDLEDGKAHGKRRRLEDRCSSALYGASEGGFLVSRAGRFDQGESSLLINRRRQETGRKSND